MMAPNMDNKLLYLCMVMRLQGHLSASVPRAEFSDAVRDQLWKRKFYQCYLLPDFT